MGKYEKYSVMRKAGKTPGEICLTAKMDGIYTTHRLEILTSICGLSIVEAKGIMACADKGAKSLSEYQEKHILPALREAFEPQSSDSAENDSKSS